VLYIIALHVHNMVSRKRTPAKASPSDTESLKRKIKLEPVTLILFLVHPLAFLHRIKGRG